MTADAWQPIATAPRDGTRVLVKGGRGFGTMAASFSEIDDGWLTRGGVICPAPTHWQPLLPPPAQEDDDGND